MKKLLCLLLTLVACCMLATVVSAEEANVPTTCEACGGIEVEWTPLAATNKWCNLDAGHYHYYLTGNDTTYRTFPNPTAEITSTNSGAAITICLDLNGYNISTDGRAIGVYGGSTLNIMDSSKAQTGYIQSTSGNNATIGGTIFSYGTFNLYSGTLRYVYDGTGKNPTYAGGVLSLGSNYPNAVFNMYGGRIEGGEMVETNGVCWGGAVYGSKGKINLYAGEIISGKLQEGYEGPCVFLNDSIQLTLSGSANVDNIYVNNAAAKVNVSGTYSGYAQITYNTGALTPYSGMPVGTATKTPSVTGDLFCTNGDGWLVDVKDGNLVLAPFTPSAEHRYCQHCDTVVRWTKLTDKVCSTIKTTAGRYHCYLAADYNRSTQFTITANSAVCLDLCGNTMTVAQRALYLYSNVKLGIMDSVGGGEIVGTTGKNNPTAGVMCVKEGSVVDMYGGTLRLNAFYLEGFGVGVGGVVYMNDTCTFNLHGGAIQGADLRMSEYKLTINGKGAAFYLNNAAQLNVSGGRILSGTLAEGCEGECVYLQSNSARVTVSGNSYVEDIFCCYENDQLTVSGEYTGTVNLTYPDTISVSENMVVGVSDGADLTSAATGCGEAWMLGVSGNDLVLIPSAPVIIPGGNGYTGYTTLQSAIDAANGGIVKLIKPIQEDVTVFKDLILDLNGKTIDGTVTIAAGATLYGMDSQTNDYTVNDASGYGKMTVFGEGQILGLPEESQLAQDGYMMIHEEGGISFHAVNLRLTAMTLRPEQAGVYYESIFGGDELVAARVKAFGVALSVQAAPTAENLETLCKYSTVDTAFTAGGMDADATSTLLKNVMKPGNTAAENNSRAQIPIYGRAYILTEDGYLFGACAQRTFKEQVESIDDTWSTLNAKQKTAVVSMYTTYMEAMQNWDIPRIIAQQDPGADGVMKILGIGNSYTQDSMWMLYNIYKKENPDKKIVLGIAYHGGCSLAQHVGYLQANSTEYTYYQISDEIFADTGTWKGTKTQTLKTIVENENWDIVTMQQASTYSGIPDTYNADIQTIQSFVSDTLGYVPTFAWNMTWAYPVKDIEGDAFETVNTTSGFESRYNSDQMTMYNAIVDTVKAKIVPDKTFRYLMPTGVAVQNANSSYLDDPDLYRDYTHLNDFSRVMAAYVWYCTFEDVQVDSLKFTVVPAGLTKSYKTAGGTGDMTLTQMQIDIIEESVKNALDTRDTGTFAITQSQYTTKE